MDKFFAAIRNMFSVPDLRRRILFTLGMLAIYRLGAHIGAPGINKDRLDQVWHDVAGTLLGVLDLFSGGNFRTISIFALGVTPYITASIILQLMTVVSPQLKKLQEEGEMGRQKINQWTRYLTVLLAGLPVEIPAATMNRLCGSGMQAVVSSSYLICSGRPGSSSSPATTRRTRSTTRSPARRGRDQRRRLQGKALPDR